MYSNRKSLLPPISQRTTWDVIVACLPVNIRVYSLLLIRQQISYVACRQHKRILWHDIHDLQHLQPTERKYDHVEFEPDLLKGLP